MLIRRGALDLLLPTAFLVVSAARSCTDTGLFPLFAVVASAALVWTSCAIVSLYSRAWTQYEGRSFGTVPESWYLAVGVVGAQLSLAVVEDDATSAAAHILLPGATLLILRLGPRLLNACSTSRKLDDGCSNESLFVAVACSCCLLLITNSVRINSLLLAILGVSCLAYALIHAEKALHRPVTDHLIDSSLWEKQFVAHGRCVAGEEAQTPINRLRFLQQASGLITLLIAVPFCLYEKPYELNELSQHAQLHLCASIIIQAVHLWLSVWMIADRGSLDTGILQAAATDVSIFVREASLVALTPLVFSLIMFWNCHPNKETTFLTFNENRVRSRLHFFAMASSFSTLLVVGLSPWPFVAPYTDHKFTDPFTYLQNKTVNQVSHPIEQLISVNEWHFKTNIMSQSKDLPQTVQTYRSRYAIPPPPNFDKWYSYAKQRDVYVYDNYDIIYDTILPFWSLKPATIRQRVRAVLANEESFVILLKISGGAITRLEGGLPWQRIALSGMLEDFVEYLPDLEIAFNAHDEPRVVVDHDELSVMVERGKQAQAAVASLSGISNRFTELSLESNGNNATSKALHTSFADYTHQAIHEPVLLSCSEDSPARRKLNKYIVDQAAAFATNSSLSFISNHTAYTDVCLTPSLQGTHAFFDRPNSLSVTHGLVPIFSESKLSSFQDIVYPSLWHWYGNVFTNNTNDMHVHNKPIYDESLDFGWRDKQSDLYWRGSTTGGYSKNGGWRRHHRQRAVKYLNGYSNATILVSNEQAPSKYSPGNLEHGISNPWSTEQVPMKSLSRNINVTFSGIGQCNDTDCHAQKEFFHITPYANISDAYQHRYVLDMDGNAFSARFYGLMRSKSAVFKQSLFREWHDEWLQEWVHYVPLSLNVGVEGRGWESPSPLKNTGRKSEWAEVLRWFLDEDAKTEARGERGPGQSMAERKRAWSQRVLRREDMQAWMFRLLLEYARVVDDRRGDIGYSMN